MKTGDSLFAEKQSLLWRQGTVFLQRNSRCYEDRGQSICRETVVVMETGDSLFAEKQSLLWRQETVYLQRNSRCYGDRGQSICRETVVVMETGDSLFAEKDLNHVRKIYKSKST